jgi:ribosomal protein S18 acetylase RimI-like enzyme
LIRPLALADAEACDAIVAGLPYHFGDAAGRDECARAVREQEGLVALDRGAVAGFLTLVRHDPRSAEISWLAVRADCRRQGRGRALVEDAARRLARDGVQLLCMLTLGPSAVEARATDNYADTRAFYEALGFVPLRELRLHGWNSRALMLARPLR